MKSLETERVRLVQLKSENSYDLFRTFSDPDVMRYWIGGPDKHLEDTLKRITEIKKHWIQHGFGDWGIVDKNNSQFLGFGGLHYINGMEEVNLGYALEKTRWRKGYGFEVCQAILQYGFQQLRLSEIVAVIWPDNKASIKLVEKCGLKYWKKTIWSGSDRIVYKIKNT